MVCLGTPNVSVLCPSRTCRQGSFPCQSTSLSARTLESGMPCWTAPVRSGVGRRERASIALWSSSEAVAKPAVTSSLGAVDIIASKASVPRGDYLGRCQGCIFGMNHTQLSSEVAHTEAVVYLFQEDGTKGPPRLPIGCLAIVAVQALNKVID